MSFRFYSSVWTGLVFFQLPVSVHFVSREDWTTSCRQVVAVVTREWESTRGRLCTLEKTGEDWVAAGGPIDVTVDRNGLGWGFGLHSGEKNGPVKRDGDKRAPAGSGNVKNLLKWLDRKKRPVLLQVPESELGSPGLPFAVALIRSSL